MVFKMRGRFSTLKPLMKDKCILCMHLCFSLCALGILDFFQPFRIIPSLAKSKVTDKRHR